MHKIIMNMYRRFPNPHISIPELLWFQRIESPSNLYTHRTEIVSFINMHECLFSTPLLCHVHEIWVDMFHKYVPDNQTIILMQ